MQDMLDQLADQILDMDSQELKALLPQIQARMDQLDHTREWERSVVAFFIINALRVKDNLAEQGRRPEVAPREGVRLRLVK
ncbi:MAG: hypothetical protein HY910_05150 [Desulfarculus sp.]|nr:hypothetical protein [Desulfarculus sp.]